MFRFLFFFFLTLLSFGFSHTTVVTENDPATLVDGVSMITGDFYLGEEDYTVAGAEPISLRRFYLSALGNIHQHPHLVTTFAVQAAMIMVDEPNGTSFFYRPKAGTKASCLIGDDFYGKKKKIVQYSPIDFVNESPGVSNTSSGSISAKSQIKNQRIIFDPSKDRKGKSFSLHTAAGSMRRYVSSPAQKKTDFGMFGKGYLAYYYRLESETLPNGRILHYEWNSNFELTAIRATNPQNTKIFSRICLSSSDDKKKVLTGSDGRSLSYVYDHVGNLGQVTSPEYPEQSFCYIASDKSAPLISEVCLPRGRRITIQYQGTKVSSLLAPSGPDGSLVPYYQFSYNLEAKNSFSLDAKGHKTAYFWNDDYRLKSIERFEGTDRFKSKETFIWEGSNIRSKVFYDEIETPLFARTFSYDSKGNILEEIFWGNLSGRGPPLHIGSNGMPIDDGVEKAIYKNQYNDRDLNVRRQEPGGLITTQMGKKQRKKRPFMILIDRLGQF